MRSEALTGEHVGSKPAVVIGIVAAGLLVGCAAPVPGPLILANRSDAILTVGPGLVIPACGSTTTTIAGYEAARTKGQELAANDQTWDAPDGALVWTFDAMAESGGVSTRTFTYVVSSSADPEMRMGRFAEDELPACGGRPRGIQPGTPMGWTPDHDLFDSNVLGDTDAPTPSP